MNNKIEAIAMKKYKWCAVKQFLFVIALVLLFCQIAWAQDGSNLAQQSFIRNLYQQTYQGTLQAGEIMFWGDSITSGYTTAYTDPSQRLVQSLPGVVKNLLNATAFPTREGIYLLFADQLADNRVSPGGYGIIPGGSGYGVFGNLYGSTGGADLIYTPGADKPFNTIRVFYADSAYVASSGWGYNVDGGAQLASLSSIVGPQIEHFSVSTSTCPLGVHALHITAPTSGTALIAGFEVYDSTHPAVGVTNAGANGTQMVQLTQMPGLLEAISPDVTILDMTHNSIGVFYPNGPSASGTATFLGWWQAFISSCPGDIIVCTEPPTLNEPGATAAQAYIRPHLKNLAALNGCMFADKWKRWSNGTGAVESAKGFYHDAVHPSLAGDTDIAFLVCKTLNNSGGPPPQAIVPQQGPPGVLPPIPLSDLAQGSATTGQTITWDGGEWAPATVNTGGQSIGPLPPAKTTVLTSNAVLSTNILYQIDNAGLTLALPQISSTNQYPVWLWAYGNANTTTISSHSGDFIWSLSGYQTSLPMTFASGGNGGDLIMLVPMITGGSVGNTPYWMPVKFPAGF